MSTDERLQRTRAPFYERWDLALNGEANAKCLPRRLDLEVPEARVIVIEAPAVQGFGNAGGFKRILQATGDVNFHGMELLADNFAAKGNRQHDLVTSQPLRFRHPIPVSDEEKILARV